MPLNEMPTFFHPEIRRLIDSALEQVWLELREQNPDDEGSAKTRHNHRCFGSHREN